MQKWGYLKIKYEIISKNMENIILFIKCIIIYIYIYI